VKIKNYEVPHYSVFYILSLVPLSEAPVFSHAHSILLYVRKKQVSIRVPNLWHFSPQLLGLFSVADELAVSSVTAALLFAKSIRA
jgi:hypothetical protein